MTQSEQSRCASSFLDSYWEWSSQSAADLDSDIFKFSVGDHVKLHGLKNKIEFNDLEGEIKSFSLQTNRFLVVGLGGSPDRSASVLCSNLYLTSCYYKIRAPREYEVILSTFFLPGMRYFGTIQIPGDAGVNISDIVGTRQTYELTIIGPASLNTLGIDGDVVSAIDSTLGYSVLARHRAYGDEQYVFIRVGDVKYSSALVSSTGVSDNAPFPEGMSISPNVSFSIEYADGETMCRGVWNPDRVCFVGNVRQTKNSVDNIFHQSDPVTHTFVLHPCQQDSAHDDHSSCAELESSQCRAMCNKRAAAWASLTRCVSSFAFLANSAGHSLAELATAVGEARAPSLRLVQWEVLMQNACLGCEEVCGVLRRMASYMDTVVFATPNERERGIEDLKRRGMSRTEAHARVDKAFMTLRAVGMTQRSATPNTQRSVWTSLYVARERLERSYERFSDSLRRAEDRLTVATLLRFEKVASAALRRCQDINETKSNGDLYKQEGINEGGDWCAICMIPLTEGTSEAVSSEILADCGSSLLPLMLPCRHAFHGECIRMWLLNHNRCPMCRELLSEEEERSGNSSSNESDS